MQCREGVNPIIIHSVTSLFNGYIQSLVEVNQAIVAWSFRCILVLNSDDTAIYLVRKQNN